MNQDEAIFQDKIVDDIEKCAVCCSSADEQTFLILGMEARLEK